MVQQHDYLFPRESAAHMREEREKEREEGGREKNGGRRDGELGPVISRSLLSFYLRAQLANIIP